MSSGRLLALLLASPLLGCSEEPYQPPLPAEPTVSASASAVGQHTARKVPTDSPAGPASVVNLEVVKYAQLVDAVHAQRGKVVVLDVWGTFCAPCKKEFPKLVELHRRFAQAGLVCMSVSVDEVGARARALQFLQSQGATFANYLLDEDAALWQQRWRLESVPVVFVFDRAGRRAGKFASDDPNRQFTYEEVIRLVEDLMRPGR
jgi:thiol-disulfide isomerase/thioredoxin